MADLIYTPNAASLGRFLKHIQTAGVPAKVTQQYLVSVGFKAKNDRYLIPVFRALGFIDASQAPTGRWTAYRDKGKASQVLGEAIRAAYSDLFATYPDAYQRDPDTIRNFLSAKSHVADSTLRLAVTTFRALAADASFDGGPPSAADVVVEQPMRAGTRATAPPAAPSLSIAIQVYVDKNMTGEQVDQVFASMARHLYGRE